MIAFFRRIRQELDAAITRWMPAQEVTRLTLRPMPWELDRNGVPTAAFRAHIAGLSARGWCSDNGIFPSSMCGKPQLRAYSAPAPLKPFERLLIATQLTGFGGNELTLSHLLVMDSGEVVGSLVTHVPLVKAAPAELTATFLCSAIAPAPIDETAQPV